MEKRLDLIEQGFVITGIQEELKKSFELEALKGCDSNLYNSPVDIEPPFRTYHLSDFLRQNSNPNISSVPKPINIQKDRVFLQLWFSTSDEFYWQSFDIILKELSIIKSPISFLLIGNCKRITCELGVSKEDAIPLRHTLTSKLPNIQIDTNSDSCFFHFIQKNKSYTFDIRDFVAPAPYWHNVVNYEALKNSSTPLLPIYSTLSNLSKEEVGFYQVIFKGTTYPWRENILNLIESELESTHYGSITQGLFPYAVLGVEDFKEAKKKLIGPYFAVSVRMGVFGRPEDTKGILDSLSLVISGVQYSERRFSYLTKADYLKIFKESDLIEMITLALVLRPGTLLTAGELSVLFNFGSKEILAREHYPLDKAVGFKATEQFLEDDGIAIGINKFAGKEIVIKQPERLRPLHTSVGGLIGKGKTYLLESMCLDDINRGSGVAVIDPHGDLIQRLLCLIPKQYLDDTVYFSPCEKDYAVCYNPFKLKSGEDIGKRVDDLIVSVRSLFPANSWGHLIESTLMTVFYTLIRGDNLCLADARSLLSKTNEGYRMRERLLPLINNPEVVMFWEDLFERMPVTTIHRVLNKLTMFLLPEKVRRIFSQKENKINFRQIIDKKKIFLCYLPAGIIGSDCANVLGSTIVAAFHNAGMSRADILPNQRTPFNIYIDEFHRFPIKSFEDSLRELRKYNVRMILAYQQREMLIESIKLALGNVGTMIVLDLDWKDAHEIYKEFYSEVELNDLMRQGTGKGFVKMDGEIVSFSTLERPKTIKGDGFRQEVIKQSIKKYYAPVKKDKKIQSKNQSEEFNRQINDEVLYDEI